MKHTLLFSSAASLLAVSGVQGADLPVAPLAPAAKPIDYVRVCDTFGSRYHYIPGTQTCLKFSGFARVEYGVQDDDKVDTNNRAFMNSEFELVTTATSLTEMGVLAGQIVITGSNEGAVRVGDAWIAIGNNLLVGRDSSRYDFGGGYGMYDGAYTDEALNQFTFLVPFRSGLSFSLGLEDNRDRRVSIAQLNETTISTTTTVSLTSVGPPPAFTVNTNTNAFTNSLASYGGMELPDVVASLRISQGWGTFQISGALHHIRAVGRLVDQGANLTTATDNTLIDASVEDQDLGFAVQAGVELKMGTRTRLKVLGAYADGAMHYVGGDNFSPTFLGAVRSFSDIPEAVFDASTGEIEDTLAGWYVLGSVQHSFSRDLAVALTGSYHDFEDYNGFNAWYVGGTVTYRVVDNLFVRLGGVYLGADADDGISLDDNEVWEAKLRIQRNF